MTRLRYCKGINPLFSVHYERSGITKSVRLNPSHHLYVLFASLAADEPPRFVLVKRRLTLASRIQQTERLDISPTLTTIEKCVKASQRFKKDQKTDILKMKTIIYSPESLARQLASYFRLV